MTNEEAIERVKILKAFTGYDKDNQMVTELHEALDMAIKALEQQPSEDCISRQALKQKLQEHRDLFVNAYGSFKDMPYDLKVRVDEISNCIAEVVNEPSVTPTNEDIKEAYLKGYDYGVKDWFKSKTQPCDDCISRQAVTDTRICEGISCNECSFNTCEDEQSGCLLKERVDKLPSVYPERINLDVIERIKRKIDEMTEIHSDGEFYIKNVDAKWIIGKYLYSAEMIGGGEDEDRKSL